MKKRINRAISSLLAVVLAGAVLAGCGGSDSSSAASEAASAASEAVEEAASAASEAVSEAAPETEAETETEAAAEADAKPVKIAYLGGISSAQASVARFNWVDTVAKATGGSGDWVDCERTPDSMLSAMEQAAAQGADAVICVPVADSMIPKIIEIAEENEIYFGFLFRYANDPDIAAELEACPWYVGNCLVYSDEQVYASTSQMAEMGVTDCVIFGQEMGDVDGDARDAAAERAAEEHGMNILNEARALSDASEATKIVESWIAAYPEMNGILIEATAVTPGITDAVITALKAHDKQDDVVLAIHDYVDGMAEAFDNGLDLAYGGDNVIAIEFLAAMLANAAQGNKLSETPQTCWVNYYVAESAEDCGNYFELIEGDTAPYTEEEVREYMLKAYNPDVDENTILDLAANYSVDEVMARHGG